MLFSCRIKHSNKTSAAYYAGSGTKAWLKRKGLKPSQKVKEGNVTANLKHYYVLTEVSQNIDPVLFPFYLPQFLIKKLLL